MSSSIVLSITPSQIIAHRAGRKASGMVGCKDGSDMPLSSMRGFSWRPADPMDPGCFCFDCRETWDADASIDLQLLQDGHDGARYTYASLLPPEIRPPPVCVSSPASLALPMRTSSAYPGVSRSTTVGLSNEPPSSLFSGAGASPSFRNTEVGPPTSLPPSLTTSSSTIHETTSDVIQRLITRLQSEQILAMDSKRRVILAATPEERQMVIDQSMAYEDTCIAAIAFLNDLDSRIFAHRQALFDE